LTHSLISDYFRLCVRFSVATSLYQVRADLFSDYLRAELRNPRIKSYSGG